MPQNIGVSNFSAQTVMDILRWAKIKPAVNQIELHPYNVQQALVDFCLSKGVSRLRGNAPKDGPTKYLR